MPKHTCQGTENFIKKFFQRKNGAIDEMGYWYSGDEVLDVSPREFNYCMFCGADLLTKEPGLHFTAPKGLYCESFELDITCQGIDYNEENRPTCLMYKEELDKDDTGILKFDRCYDLTKEEEGVKGGN